MLLSSRPLNTSASALQRAGIIGLLAIATLCPISSYLSADEIYWQVLNGDWSDTDPCPWNPAVEPDNDNAYIINGGTAYITQMGEQCNYLYLGGTNSAAGNPGTIRMSAGSLDVDYSYVGRYGKGAFIQSGGREAIYKLVVGDQSGGDGAFQLTDSGDLAAYSETIGTYGGKGVFTQTGGTNLTSYLTLGYYWGGATGTYNLSGGSLTVDGSADIRVYIGYASTGIFNQSGGSFNAGYGLYLGFFGGTGTYDLSGQSELKGVQIAVGRGSFTQSGGTCRAGDNTGGGLVIGTDPGGTVGDATYTLSGGSLTAAGMVVAQSGYGHVHAHRRNEFGGRNGSWASMPDALNGDL